MQTSHRLHWDHMHRFTHQDPQRSPSLMGTTWDSSGLLSQRPAPLTPENTNSSLPRRPTQYLQNYRGLVPGYCTAHVKAMTVWCVQPRSHYYTVQDCGVIITGKGALLFAWHKGKPRPLTRHMQRHLLLRKQQITKPPCPGMAILEPLRSL